MINATRKWILLKLSSFLMVPFMIWFLIKFVSIYDGDNQSVVSVFSNQFMAIIFSIFITITFFHSALSISEIFEDYISSENTRKFANMMVYLSSFLIPLITIITLCKI